MENNTEESTPTRHQRHVYVFLFWASLVLILYFLSIGPVMWYYGRTPGAIRTDKMTKVLERVYRPLEWLYEETPLHKPIGMYLSLWNKRFGRDGERTD